MRAPQQLSAISLHRTSSASYKVRIELGLTYVRHLRNQLSASCCELTEPLTTTVTYHPQDIGLFARICVITYTQRCQGVGFRGLIARLEFLTSEAIGVILSRAFVQFQTVTSEANNDVAETSRCYCF